MVDEDVRGSLAEGTLVGGRFRVERLIGRGGMGEVYSARHTTTLKQVALKRIHVGGDRGHEHERRFMTEARAATAIRHPNVVEVYDLFEDEDGSPVMVMELLSGESLSALRARAGALPLCEIAAILLPAARALREAHAKGIVHRDLKPDNLFLADTPSGRTTKILDFGIAKIIDPAKLGSDTQGQPTRTGALLGTPHYMSYEQAMSDKRVDQRTDVWAIGVILFEALTGRRPLVYETLGEMYTIFLQGQVPSITRFVPDIPPEAAAVIDRSLAKLPADRASDLGPLIEMLAKYSDPTVPGARCGGRGVAGAAPTENESTGAPLSKSLAGARRRGRKGGARPAVVLAAVASLAAVAGAGGLAWRSRSPAATLEAARPTPSLASTIAIAPPPEPSAVPALVVEAAAPTATHRRSLAVAAGDAGQGADARSPTESPHGISSKLPY